MSAALLGKALSSIYSTPEGKAQLFERGLMLGGQPGEAVAVFNFPKIGRPGIASVQGELTKVLGATAIHFRTTGWEAEQLAKSARGALEERLFLKPTGVPDSIAIPLSVVGVSRLGDHPSAQGGYGVELGAAGLTERQLYDIVIEGEDGHRHVVAPHAVYCRTDWTDFGFAHITDMHVARRIDQFKRLLKGAGRPLSAEKMYNWNDRFRGFVKYANYLHGIGKLDVIFATGDLYDYIYERGEDQTGGGNAQFLRDLILGTAPGPDFPDVEELRVPIFMVPGNHDYRTNPYDLIFDVHIPGKDLTRISNYQGYNLSREDACILGNILTGGHGSEVPNISSDDAARQVAISEVPPCRGLLCEDGAYVVTLGPHKFLMLDTRHDVGVVDDPLEAIIYALGLANEDQMTFVGGSPNSDGISDQEVDWAKKQLSAENGEGLLVLGLHAPLLNMWNNEYPYFLRETQRKYQPDQAETFLARHNVQQVIQPGGSTPGRLMKFSEACSRIRAAHPAWFPSNSENVRDHRAPSFVKRGDIADHLDFGVASSREHSPDKAYALLKLLAGIGTPRPADLVLAGHTHRHNEFRVGIGYDGELAYYMDFYTENPSTYYPTRYFRKWPSVSYQMNEGFAETYVDIVAGSSGDMRPWPISGWLLKNVIQVPPYANPLNSAEDSAQWWEQHRPLILQTGALGPLDNSQATFTGFRVITVKNNVIRKIDFIPTDRLEAKRYDLSWEEATRVDGPRRLRFIGRTEQYGMPAAASAPWPIFVPGRGVQLVLYRDANGRLYELWRDGNGATGAGDLTAAANAPQAAGNPSAYFDTLTNSTIVLYRGQDGHVHSLYSSGGPTGHDNLSAAAHAPTAIGNPFGYFTPGRNMNHVIYRSADKHLRALYWHGTETCQHADLIGGTGFPLSAGDPSAYFNGSNVVVYRGINGHIHSIYWLDGPSGHDDLSGVAGTPLAAGDPVAYYLPQGDVNQVTYRSVDGHLHELWWQGASSVSGWDLSVASGAPPAVSDPAAFYNPTTNTKHVVYRSGDGHLHELRWTPGGGIPAHTDLTADADAPPAADRPAAFALAGLNANCVVYRGENGQIYELRCDAFS